MVGVVDPFDCRVEVEDLGPLVVKAKCQVVPGEVDSLLHSRILILIQIVVTRPGGLRGHSTIAKVQKPLAYPVYLKVVFRILQQSKQKAELAMYPWVSIIQRNLNIYATYLLFDHSCKKLRIPLQLSSLQYAVKGNSLKKMRKILASNKYGN